MNARLPSSHDPVVQTTNLTKTFGSFTALDGLSIHADRGQILGFIGPNGAGKTTTIKILVGLARPTSGTATIAGTNCTTQSKKIKRLVGYMPDKFGVYENMRVREYLDFFAATYGVGVRERRRRIEETLELTGTTYMRDRYVEALSHGMQQRLGIARIMLHDPQVLILDEPANGLDPQARIEMRELLLRLAQLGKTLLVTSHILPELSRICDTVAILMEGKLRAFGSLDEVMRKLCPRSTLEIQLVDGEQIEAVTAFLEHRREGSELICPSPAESLVRLETQRTDRESAALLRELVQQGIEISQFRVLQSNLEDAFVKVLQPVPLAGGDGEPGAKMPDTESDGTPAHSGGGELTSRLENS